MYIVFRMNKGVIEARQYNGQYTGEEIAETGFDVLVRGDEPQVANNIEGVLAALCRDHCRATEVIIPMSVVDQTVGHSPDVRGYG